MLHDARTAALVKLRCGFELQGTVRFGSRSWNHFGGLP